MPVGIYTDVQIPRSIVTGLRLGGVDVLTAQQDGMAEAEDSEILDRATELGRIVFTHDDDFLKEVSMRLLACGNFSGGDFRPSAKSPNR